MKFIQINIFFLKKQKAGPNSILNHQRQTIKCCFINYVVKHETPAEKATAENPFHKFLINL
ncbi:hypothetical protein GCM10008924_29590 [Gracilibacillus halotolerans]